MVSSKTVTDAQGRFELYFGEEDFVAINEENEKTKSEYVTLKYKFNEIAYERLVDFDSIGFPIIVLLDTLPANSEVKLVHQPLRTKNSLATFDLIIYNSGNANAEVGRMLFQLRVTEHDCDWKLEGGVHTVSEVLVLNLDDENSVVESDNPIIEDIRFSPEFDYLCGTVEVFQGLTIKANDVLRFRVDVQSEWIRKDFNRYATGELVPQGGYVLETGEAPPNSRLFKKDLRYYIVEAEIVFLPVADKYPYGKVHVISEMDSGKFGQRDSLTLQSD